MDKFDVVVIGAGPGGYVAAIRASQLGLKTAIVEKRWLGGVCLNEGCIPTKSLLKNAEIAHLLRERAADFGISFDNLKMDYAKAVKRSRQVSTRLTQGVGFLLKKNNVTTIIGEAKVLSPSRVQVTNAEGSMQALDTENIIIATGSYPIQIPGVTVDGEKIITYKEAIVQEKLPASVLIIGAGAIGLEFATIWNAYGVKVTIVEMLPAIAPLEDAEVSAELTKAFKKKGIEILVDTKVISAEKTKQGLKVKVSGKTGDQVLEVEQVLVAIGFKPNSLGFGLEDVGVALNERKQVIVDEFMATNVKGIWAIGDVTGKLLLAHVASKQGIMCAETIAGKKTRPINYPMVPRATYCQPQVASFGLTESKASENGRKIKVGRFPFQANGKALGMGESGGFVKIIVDEKYGEILGAHLIGPDVSELLPELTLAQRNELTISEVSENIHAHPTLSEVLMEAAEAAEGKSIHI